MTEEQMLEYRREAVDILVAGLRERAPATAEALVEHTEQPTNWTAFEYGAVTGIAALLAAIDMGTAEECLTIAEREHYP